MTEFRIETERLILREWQDDDIDALLAICRDPCVMAFLGPVQSHSEVTASVARQQSLQSEMGYCYWALERKSDHVMIGFCGLMKQGEGLPISSETDIGWRLAHSVWGQGYAQEAAKASIDWGFANLPNERIWAITVPANIRSWGLMERLGMARHVDMDFDHPSVADGSPLKRHITYSIGRDKWTV